MQELAIGDILITKKPHPCGSSEWEILRTGADLRLKCLGCGRMILLARREAEKRLRAVKPGGNDA
ncbi:MAG: DUF951 domain-containing protein [Lachnospiraceae bacterium]|nr:DUF951 domain-containing protein [Lachnospiraceae bacterium]